jgi:hypothetical protein
MEALALFISLAALICAGLAYRKSGGSLDELKPRVEDLGRITDTLKTRMADMLEAAEKKLRDAEKKPGDKPGAGAGPQQGANCVC